MQKAPASDRQKLQPHIGTAARPPTARPPVRPAPALPIPCRARLPHRRPAWRGDTYLKYRPCYPPSIYEAILDFHRGERRLAVDVGTGNGQAAVGLAPHFEQASRMTVQLAGAPHGRGRWSKRCWRPRTLRAMTVIGLDPSESQLAHAQQAAGVSYRCGIAEATGLPPGSADLLTTATALHWFNLPAFFRECRRVLRPSGTLAAFCYTNWRVDHPGVDEVRRRFWEEHSKPLLHPRLCHTLESGYEGLEPGPSDFAVVQRMQLPMQRSVDVAWLLGWQRSTSIHASMLERDGEAATEALLQRYAADLLAAVGGGGDNSAAGSSGGGLSFPLRWEADVVLILAREPQPLRAAELEESARERKTTLEVP
eukprot:scaffold2.g7296.t1